MTLRAEIEKLQNEMMPQVPHDALEAIAAATGRLIKSGLAEQALSTGDTIPPFELGNATGNEVSSVDLLRKGPLVINFYRGGWCPFCNLELVALQRELPQITKAGATLVAISPNLPNKALTSIEKHSLQFEVLSDLGNKVARLFGLVFALAEEIRPIYSKFGLLLPDYNGDEKWQLPIPATYVVGSNGKILNAYVNADYTQRLEPQEIVRILKRLGKPQIA